jgi:hypothetical protein
MPLLHCVNKSRLPTLMLHRLERASGFLLSSDQIVKQTAQLLRTHDRTLRDVHPSAWFDVLAHAVAAAGSVAVRCV